MDKSKQKKLLELRKKKIEKKKQEVEQQHKQLTDALSGLHALFDEKFKNDAKASENLLKELKKLDSFSKEVSKVEKAIKKIPRTENVKVSNLSEIINNQKELNLTEVVEAIQELTTSVENQSVESVMVDNRKADDFIPTRRVRLVRGKLIFDDEPLKVNVIGGGSSIVNNYNKETAQDVRFDPDESAPLYIGTHMTKTNASTSDTNWYISKFTRADGKATRIQRRKGSWDDRAIGW